MPYGVYYIQPPLQPYGYAMNVLYTYIGVGLSTLLVSTNWAMRRPLHRGTGNKGRLHVFCICTIVSHYCFRQKEPLPVVIILDNEITRTAKISLCFSMGKALQCLTGNGLQWAYKSETGLSVFIESGTMERRPAYGMLVHRCRFASNGFRAGNQFLGWKE